MSEIPQPADRELDLPARQLFESAMAAHRAGALDVAEKGYRAVLDRAPDHADALHLLGGCRHQRRDDRTAYELATRAIEVNPDATVYHDTLGLILRSAGNPELAVKSFSRAIRLGPENRKARNNLALTLCEMRRFAEAETVLRHSLAEWPGDPLLLNGLGRLLLMAGDTEGSVAVFHEVLKVAPDHVGALNNIGVAFNLLNDIDDARAAFRRALALDPDHVDAHHNYGQLLLLEGRYAEAWPHFEWRLRGRDYRRRFTEPR